MIARVPALALSALVARVPALALSALVARVPALALSALVGCVSPSPAPHLVTVSDGRYSMGTVLELTLRDASEVRARGALEAAFALAARLEGRMTVYDPASDVSRLNAAAGSGPQTVDLDVTRVLARAQELAQLTGGAFDVTLGPLIALWTRAAETGAPPTDAELAAARSRVGPAMLRVHRDARAELVRPGASVNLGGIAKGFAIDRIRERLAQQGIRNALLNFGQSSTWAMGTPADGQGWRLLARGPDDDVLGVLTLRDKALSVSGSLGQFVEIGGRRYGHVLDPRSGVPLTRRRQALVVASDATLAEGLSKALLVLGEAEGVALVEAQPGCEALLADADGRRWKTRGWDRAVRFEEVHDSGADGESASLGRWVRSSIHPHARAARRYAPGP